MYQLKKSHQHSFNICLLNFCIVLAIWNLLMNKIETSSCPSDFNLNTFFLLFSGPSRNVNHYLLFDKLGMVNTEVSFGAVRRIFRALSMKKIIWNVQQCLFKPIFLSWAASVFLPLHFAFVFEHLQKLDWEFHFLCLSSCHSECLLLCESVLALPTNKMQIIFLPELNTYLNEIRTNTEG